MKRNDVAFFLLFGPMLVYAAKPIYPAEIMGRDLLVEHFGWLGHVGVSTAPHLKENAYQVIEVLKDETPVIQTHSITDFKSRSPYWGSRYGISDRGPHALRILREANAQKDLFCATYSRTPDYMPGKGYYNKAGKAIATSCGYFRCDTFVNYLFNWGGYRLPTYNPPGPNVIVSTLPRLVFKVFPYSNEGARVSGASDYPENRTEQALQSPDFTSSQDFIAMPLEAFVAIIDASTRNIEHSQYFLKLAQDKQLDDRKREYLFDVLGFIADTSAIPDLIDSYKNEQNASIKKQLLATIQNIRQRLIDQEDDSPEKKLLHDFYLTLLDKDLSSAEKEMVLRGYLASSASEEVLSHEEKFNHPTFYSDMHPRVALGLKLELLHKSSDMEDVLIPDIIHFLNLQSNVELEEVFNVYLVNRFIHAGINSINSNSKAQIKDYLNSVKYKYSPGYVKTIDDRMSILSHGAWLEAFALAHANSIKGAERDMIKFLSAMDSYEQGKYVVGLSSRVSPTVSKAIGGIGDAD